MEFRSGRIEAVNNKLGAYYRLNERARKAAADAERALRERKPLGPLHSIPNSVKDPCGWTSDGLPIGLQMVTRRSLRYAG